MEWPRQKRRLWRWWDKKKSGQSGNCRVGHGKVWYASPWGPYSIAITNLNLTNHLLQITHSSPFSFQFSQSLHLPQPPTKQPLSFSLSLSFCVLCISFSPSNLSYTTQKPWLTRLKKKKPNSRFPKPSTHAATPLPPPPPPPPPQPPQLQNLPDILTIRPPPDPPRHHAPPRDLTLQTTNKKASLKRRRPRPNAP